MKTLSIICYAIGAILLIISCFLTSIAGTWWTGSISVAFLIAGCVFQYQDNKNTESYLHHRH